VSWWIREMKGKTGEWRETEEEDSSFQVHSRQSRDMGVEWERPQGSCQFSAIQEKAAEEEFPSSLSLAQEEARVFYLIMASVKVAVRVRPFNKRLKNHSWIRF